MLLYNASTETNVDEELVDIVTSTRGADQAFYVELKLFLERKLRLYLFVCIDFSQIFPQGPLFPGTYQTISRWVNKQVPNQPEIASTTELQPYFFSLAVSTSQAGNLNALTSI